MGSSPAAPAILLRGFSSLPLSFRRCLLVPAERVMNSPKANHSKSRPASEETIFVVDDEPMLLELAAVILEPLGYNVKTFRDPQSAVDAFTASKPLPSLVITDYAMHSMTGMDLIEACRKIQPQQRVLLVSGTVDENIYRNSSVKPDEFLAKPYQAKQLVDLVETLLRH
jgi:DNA-binding NtrC family response regulator